MRIRSAVAVTALACLLMPGPRAAGQETPAITPEAAREAQRVSAEPSAAQRKLSRLISVRVENVPLGQGVDQLREASGLNIFVNWQSLRQVGVTEETPVSVTLNDAPVGTTLSLALESASDGLGWALRDGVVVVGSQQYLRSHTTLRVYDVSDLIDHRLGELADREAREAFGAEQAMAELQEAVTDTAAEPVASSGFGSLLAVRASLLGHAQVEEALMKLRRAANPRD